MDTTSTSTPKSRIPTTDEFLLGLKVFDAFLQARLDLAQLFFRNRKFDEAKALYLDVIKTNPKERDAYFNMGVLLSEAMGKTGEAIPFFNKAIEMDPNDTAARRFLERAQAKKRK